MTNNRTKPEQWAVELADEVYHQTHLNGKRFAALTIQRAFEDRERKLRDENKLLREALDADCTAFAAMEAKLIEVAGRISGSNGGPPCHPDPVLLSEWVSEINHAALKETPDAL